MNYCQQCGAEMTKEWRFQYDSQTGEKVYSEVCSREPCDHGRHLENFQEDETWLDILFGKRCKKCGKRFKND